MFAIFQRNSSAVFSSRWVAQFEIIKTRYALCIVNRIEILTTQLLCVSNSYCSQRGVFFAARLKRYMKFGKRSQTLEHQPDNRFSQSSSHIYSICTSTPLSIVNYHYCLLRGNIWNCDWRYQSIKKCFALKKQSFVIFLLNSIQLHIEIIALSQKIHSC